VSRRPAVLAGALAACAAFAVVMLIGGDPGREAEQPVAPVAASQRDGLAVWARMGCGGCHRLAAARSRGAIGPSLDVALEDDTAESLRAKVLDDTVGGLMPTDYARRLHPGELHALVAFLLSTREGSRAP
jgi:cytochrome c oxidase subunit 2